MNLVELKGYNHTKDHLDKNRSSMLEESVISLESQLLQYRREHNIFEVGDYIVDTVSNQFFKVVEVDGNNLLINNRFWVVAMYQRHATDEEIKVGKRL